MASFCHTLSARRRVLLSRGARRVEISGPVGHEPTTLGVTPLEGEHRRRRDPRAAQPRKGGALRASAVDHARHVLMRDATAQPPTEARASPAPQPRSRDLLVFTQQFVDPLGNRNGLPPTVGVSCSAVDDRTYEYRPWPRPSLGSAGSSAARRTSQKVTPATPIATTVAVEDAITTCSSASQPAF